jgi:hypothetical protein
MTEHGMASHITQEKEAKTMSLTFNSMGPVFWDAESGILVKFLPQWKTINATYYLKIF